MSSTKANPRKVLAEFAENIDEGKGWWFRAPTGPDIIDNNNKGVVMISLKERLLIIRPRSCNILMCQ